MSAKNSLSLSVDGLLYCAKRVKQKVDRHRVVHLYVENGDNVRAIADSRLHLSAKTINSNDFVCVYNDSVSAADILEDLEHARRA